MTRPDRVIVRAIVSPLQRTHPPLGVPTGRVYVPDNDHLGMEPVDLDGCRVYILADPDVDGGEHYLNVYYTKDRQWVRHTAAAPCGDFREPWCEWFTVIAPRQAASLIAEWTDGYLPQELESLGEPEISPETNGRAPEASADRPDLAAVRENAEKLRSALQEMRAVDEASAAKKGCLRFETGLTDREYREAIKLLKAVKAVRTKPGVGSWLTPLSSVRSIRSVRTKRT